MESICLKLSCKTKAVSLKTEWIVKKINHNLKMYENYATTLGLISLKCARSVYNI